MEDYEMVDPTPDDSFQKVRDQQEEARMWKREITQALSREKEWRKEAQRAYNVYTPESANSSSFNIFWPNTETLCQATYNSLPTPVVKRRYDDADPLGKASAITLQRAIAFSTSTPTCKLAELGKKDVLSMLIAGRGLSRLRYLPTIVSEDSLQEEEKEGAEEESAEYFSMTHSENFLRLEWEQIQIERVQWEDLILGPAKTWEDVPWIAFRLKMKKEAVEKYFGANGVTADLPYTTTTLSEGEKDTEGGKELQSGKMPELWEVWDKEKREVLFIHLSATVPLKKLEDPYHLQAFFPCPRPLYAISRDNSTIPVTLYSQYRAQAVELNRITIRINKLINLVKVRGVYDSVIKELSTVSASDDGILTPSENVAQLRQIGGLDKAIWMMPIDVIVNVLRELLIQRNEIKQVIYEITGISDIMRASTQASETLGAQQLKVSWGSQRLQRLQAEVQRYFSDLLSLIGEMIPEHISLGTLRKMTLLPFRTQEEVEQEFLRAQMQYQQEMLQYQTSAQRQPPSPNQPPPQLPTPPQPSQEITWEAIYKCLQSDTLRTFHISIDTDSTIAETQSINLDELSKALAAVSQVITSFAPLVQERVMPIEVVKELCLSVSRKARLGCMIEDALDKIQQPPPPKDPEEGKRETAKAVEEIRLQSKMQEIQLNLSLEQQKMQLEAQAKEKELTIQAQFNELQVRQEIELERQRQILQDAQASRENEMEMQRSLAQNASNERIAQLEAQVKILITKMQVSGDIGMTEMDGINKLQIEQAKGMNSHLTEITKAAVTPSPIEEKAEGEEN